VSLHCCIIHNNIYNHIIVYKNIKPLQPYFFSLREIKNNVSLDLKLPVTWKYEKIAQVYKTLQVKIQDKNDKSVLVSFVAVANEDGFDTAFQCANEVVIKNLEEEQKRKLFDEKVRELRDVFEKTGLDELHSLKFKKNDKEIENEGLSLVGEGGSEGSPDGGHSQDEDDSGTTEDEEGGSIHPTNGKEKE